jgi:hypothetical protein
MNRTLEEESVLRGLFRWNLIAPFLFIAVAVLDAVLGWDFGLSGEGFIFSVIVGLVFLNHIHIAFTFMMLESVPELRAWVKDTYGSRRNFWIVIGLLFTVLYVAMGWLQGILFRDESMEKYLKGFFFVFYEAAGARHLLWQSQGIYLNLYSGTTDKPEYPELRRFLGLMGAAFLLAVALDSTHRTIVHKPFFYLAGVASTLGLVLLYLIYKRHSHNRDHRIFLGRYFLWPLGGFSELARFGFQAVHGIEYLWVSKHMLKSKGLKLRQTILPGLGGAVLLPVIAAALSIVILRTPEIAPDLARTHQDPLLWIFNINIALTFTHYYMDYKLFRMKDARTRATVGPMLENLGR